MNQVICRDCRKEEHDDCINVLKGTKTWCDCAHKQGVILQPSACKHYNMNNSQIQCPTCGATKEAIDGKDNSSGDAAPESTIPTAGETINKDLGDEKATYEAKRKEIHERIYGSAS